MVTAAMKLKTLAPWKTSYDKPRQCLKSRDITLLTKLHIVKAMVFSVAMYGWESWTIKKAEHRRTDAFELWCWRRLLRESLAMGFSRQEYWSGLPLPSPGDLPNPGIEPWSPTF